jgi:hypothetical protein
MAGIIDQVLKFLEIELPIGVGEENEIVPGGHNAAFEGRAVAAIIGVMDRPHLGVLLGEFIADRRGRIPAAIVYQDNFPRLRQFGQDKARGLDGMPNVSLFVISGKYNRKANGSWRVGCVAGISVPIVDQLVSHELK